jgi:pimeloyl-ACP methyl ester carboxylesterase
VATARWLETTDRDGIILFGHSTGGQAALRIALLVPDRIAGVVIAGPTFAPPVRQLGVLLRRVPAALRREPFGEIGVVAPAYLASGGVEFVRFLRTALDDRPEDTMAQLAMPILVLTGQHDGFAPPTWAHHLAALASAPCTVLPGSHNAPYPYPGETDAALHRAVQAWSGSGSMT